MMDSGLWNTPLVHSSWLCPIKASGCRALWLERISQSLARQSAQMPPFPWEPCIVHSGRKDERKEQKTTALFNQGVNQISIYLRCLFNSFILSHLLAPLLFTSPFFSPPLLSSVMYGPCQIWNQWDGGCFNLAERWEDTDTGSQRRGMAVAFHHLFLLSLPVSHIDQHPALTAAAWTRAA